MLELITEKSENEIIGKMTKELNIDPQTMELIQTADDEQFENEIMEKRAAI